MTKREIKDACSLLDTQYNYIKEPHKYLSVLSKQQQTAYYEGMKTIIEDILLGSEDILIRDQYGKHDIINQYVPF